MDIQRSIATSYTEDDLRTIKRKRDELKLKVGRAPYKLLDCPRCNTLGTLIEDSATAASILLPSFPWSKALRCLNCTEEWSICICCSGRSHFTLATQINRHNNNRIHVQEREQISEHERNVRLHTSSTADDADNSDTTEFPTANHDNAVGETFLDDPDHHGEIILTGGLASTSVTPTTSIFPFSSERNRDYFKMEHLGLGCAYLISHSQFRTKTQAHRLSAEEISLQLDLASLLASCTAGQIGLLNRFMGRYESLRVTPFLRCTSDHPLDGTASPDRSPIPSEMWQTRVPIDKNQTRRIFLEGKCAYFPNLPRPNIIMLENHAYAPVMECLEDLLGHGIDIDAINDISNVTSGDGRLSVKWVTETKRAEEILDNAKTVHGDISNVVVIHGVEWSDGFEPNQAAKANRSSVWAKTLSIAQPKGKYHSVTNTFLIAVGRSEDCHEEVEAKFAEELTILRSGSKKLFYHGGLKRDVYVHFELFVSLMDQPERRSANYIMLGTSTFTARWGHAGDFASVISGIPACPACFARLTSNEERQQCQACAQWDTEVDNGVLDFELPKNFPANAVILRNNKLRPMKITYQIMKDAVDRAHRQVLDTTWTVPVARAYLRIHGLNTDAMDDILDCAANCRNYSIADQQKNENPGCYEAMVAEKTKNPNGFTKWSFPSLWTRGVQLDQHIDVCMHLLFLGVIKTTVHRVQEWTKRRSKYSSFMRYAGQKSLDSVQQLGLEWCKVLPYGGGKLGGWVSENYLAMGRLMCWFYEPLATIAVDEVYVEPDRPFARWTKPDNQKWLTVRGLNAVGTAEELRAIVAAYKSPGGEVSPPVIPQSGGVVQQVP